MTAVRLRRLELGPNGFDMRLQKALTIDLPIVERSDAAGGEEVGVGDADEGEESAEVGLNEVEGSHRRACVVNATGGDDEVSLLVAEQAFGSSVGVGEGLTGADDL